MQSMMLYQAECEPILRDEDLCWSRIRKLTPLGCLWKEGMKM